MKKFTKDLGRMCFITLCVVMYGNTADAATFTAKLTGGNFNAGTTWVSGTAPGALISTDVVIIPAGSTVTLTSNEVFSGASSLTVAGVLNSTAGTTLAITAGTLAGAGTINADSMSLGLVAGFTFTGPIKARALTSLGANIASAANVTVNKSLNLVSGILNMTAGNLTMGNLSTINMAGGTITSSGTSILALDSSYNVIYTLSSATAGLELNGSGFKNLTINVPGAVTLAASETITGTLTLTAGTLVLAANTLTFGTASSIAATGAGTITGSATSNIIVNATGGLTNPIPFTTGSNMLNNLTVNTTAGAVALGADLAMSGVTTLTSGALSLNGHTLTLNPTATIAGAGTITGSTTSNLVVNTTGGLTNPLAFTTGSNMLNNLTVNTATGGVALVSDLALNGLLTLTSGTLSFVGHTLTLNPTANIAAGAGTITGSALSSLVVNTTGGLTNPLAFTAASSMLNNLTVNTTTGGVTMAADLALSGVMTLTSGTLSLNGHTLTLNSAANVAATGTGTITGSPLSNLVVNTTGSLTGAIRFAAGAAGALNNLIVNTTTGAVTLGSNLAINGMMTLTSGALSLAGNTLTMNATGNIATGAGTITGSTTSNLIVNTTGGLTNPLAFTAGSNMLSNLTVNTVTGGVTMASDLALSGLLTLSSGALALAGHTLTLNATGNIAATGTGTLTGSTASNLVVNTVGGLTNPLPFTAGSSMLNNLTLNTVSGGAALASDLALSGVMTLTSGTLSLAGHTLTLNSAANVAATGTGTITGSTSSNLVVNTTGGLTGAIRFATGAGGTLNNLVVNTTTGVVTLGSSLAINGLMTLTSGTLALANNTLTLNAAGNIATAAGTITGSTSSNLVVNTTGGLTNPLAFTAGSSMLNNFTVNTVTGSTIMGSNLTVSGLLSLTSGTLAINGHTLTLNANADVLSATGTLTGSTSSNIIVNTTFGLTGALTFATGGNMLNDLTINMGSSNDNLMLGSNLTILGMLDLQSGKIKLGTNNLDMAIAATVTGGSQNSYVMTNGTGSLMMSLATATTDTFKVGSATNYAPMALTANAGATTGDVSINVADGALSNGTSGTLLTAPMVNATWFVSSTASSINYNMLAMWSAGMQVNGFNRTDAYISHYTSGAWDMQTASAATTVGTMSAMSRTGITSLSPFMVASASGLLVPVVSSGGMNVSIYPNPVSNTLSYTATASISNIEIYNTTGQVVKSADGSQKAVSVQDLPTGVYFIHFYGNDLNTVQKFVKQ